MQLKIKSSFFWVIELPIFSFLYYLPIITKTKLDIFEDANTAQLISDALKNNFIQFEIALNSLTHVVLITLAYLLAVFFSRGIQKSTATSYFLARAFALITSLAILISINNIIFPDSKYKVFIPQLSEIWIIIFIFSIFICSCIYITYKLKLTSYVAFTVFAISSILLIFSIELSNPIKSSDRNIIIIGIDSLSEKTLAKEAANLPNISNFINSSVNFTNVYTPLARTFPAWVSILSGVSPAKSGAIFNLRNLEHIDKSLMLPYELQQLGYQSILAMDDRRFANITKDFGFNKIIGPKIGALDFLLQDFNDTPLSNILLQTRLSKYFLPYSYLNVASPVNYDAFGFANAIVKSTNTEKSNFIAAHFEAAHYPFSVLRNTPRKRINASLEQKHEDALILVDSQIKTLLDGLKIKGILNDALVIMLSDHGEDFGQIEHEFTSSDNNIIESYGHGGDILSNRQNKAIFSINQFSNGKIINNNLNINKNLSLINTKEIINYYITNGSIKNKFEDTCFFVETGFRANLISDYNKIDLKKVISSNAINFEISKNGLLQLKEEKVRSQAKNKDVGIRCLNSFSYFNSKKGSYYKYSRSNENSQFTQVEIDSSSVNEISIYREMLANSSKKISLVSDIKYAK